MLSSNGYHEGRPVPHISTKVPRYLSMFENKLITDHHSYLGRVPISGRMTHPGRFRLDVLEIEPLPGALFLKIQPTGHIEDY